MALTVEFSEVHRLSAEEFQQMVESGALEEIRVEFINGFLCDVSPRTAEHDRIAAYLTRLVADALERSYQLRVASALTIGDSAPEPDFAVVRPGTPEPYHPATAELVIEVSHSSLRRDLMVKPPIYASAGVEEYWVIDFDHARAIVHRDPTDGAYRSITEIGPADSLDGSVVGIDPIPVADIFAAARRPA
jgi:Uma2 family endonuclease